MWLSKGVVWNVTCLAWNVKCDIVNAKIVDVFQPIDIFCVLVMKIEMQGRTKETPWYSG